MIYSILLFLNASPLTVFLGTSEGGSDMARYFKDVFESFIIYIVTDDERVRYLTSIIARKIMTEGTLANWRANGNVCSELLRLNFWRST